MSKLTDAQLTWMFTERLSGRNGFQCGRLLTENGVPGTERRCEGTTTIVDGRLRYDGTCGEPCSFICEDAGALQRAIDEVVQLDGLVTEARSR